MKNLRGKDMNHPCVRIDVMLNESPKSVESAGNELVKSTALIKF
jgi:hypothetical protein